MNEYLWYINVLMDIGIDARLYGTRNRGLGRYLVELLPALEQADSSNEYTVFLRKNNESEYQPINPRFKKSLWDVPWYTAREQISFSPLRGPFDLLHFPHWNVPALLDRPYVVTIHDLILLDFPTERATTHHRFFYQTKYIAFRWLLERVLRRAKAVIAVSHATEAAIRKHFPFVKNLSVIYEGTPQLSAPVAFPLAERGITKRYILYVGACYPHKNIPVLLDAFAHIQKTQDVQLVLVGRHDFFWKRVMADAARAGKDKEVVFFGQASDSALAYLYKNAAATIAPSLLEGFAFSALEAMTAHCPVIASRIPCFEELLGGAAHFVDPRSSEDMAVGMTRVLNDASLQSSLRAAGLECARRYSWARLATELMNLYNQL